VDREHGAVNVCELTGVCESKIEVIQQMRATKNYGELRCLLLMEKSEREERTSTKKRSSRLFREAINDIIQAADGVFVTPTQAGSQCGRTLVDACNVVGIDGL
jgi:hypothetical protein